MSKVSRAMSRILRHEPELAGLKLRSGGWVPVREQLSGMRKAGHKVTMDDIMEAVETNDKRRFTLSENGGMIRAAQGHSVDVDLMLTPSEPPDILYHGTASSSLDEIFRSGISRMSRHMVHLSLDRETAERVGGRHGKPTVLSVNAKGMRDAGHEFFVSDNGVWLTGHVDPEFISF